MMHYWLDDGEDLEDSKTFLHNKWPALEWQRPWKPMTLKEERADQKKFAAWKEAQEKVREWEEARENHENLLKYTNTL